MLSYWGSGFHPLLGGQEFESRGLNLLTSAGLVLIVWTLRRERWALAIGVGLGLPCLGLNLLALWQTPDRILDLLGHALLATFYGFTAAVFLKHILFSHGLRVKRATLYESACVYLLLGLFWGTLYSFMEPLFARFLSSRPCSSRSPSGLVGLSLSQLCHPHDFGLRRPRSGGPDGPVVDFARGRGGCVLCDGAGSSFGLNL